MLYRVAHSASVAISWARARNIGAVVIRTRATAAEVSLKTTAASIRRNPARSAVMTIVEVMMIGGARKRRSTASVAPLYQMMNTGRRASQGE